MVCFHQSRFKLAVVTAVFAVWTLVLGFMAFVSAHADGLWPYLGLSLFGPLALAGAVAVFTGAMSLAHPATLTADQSGVVFLSWRGERRIAAEDIAEFIVLSPERRLRSPGVQLKIGPRKFVSFGRNWEKAPEEIVDALNAGSAPLPQ